MGEGAKPSILVSLQNQNKKTRQNRRFAIGKSPVRGVETGEWSIGPKPSKKRAEIHHASNGQVSARPYKEITEKTVMGIDLGVNTPAAIHFRTDGKPNKWAMCIGNGRMMLHARGVVRREIVRLLRGLKRKDSPIQGLQPGPQPWSACEV